MILFLYLAEKDQVTKFKR